MHNDKEDRKSGEGISVTMSHEALMNLISEINGARPTEKPPRQPLTGKFKLGIGIDEDSDTCLCRGEDELVCVTVTADADRTRTVQIKACPAYYTVYEICRDGTKVRLFKGRRGTVYGLMKQIVHESRKE